MTTPRSSQFALHADDQAVLEAADKFARKMLAPLSGRMDNEEWWPPEAFPQIGAAGFMGAAHGFDGPVIGAAQATERIVGFTRRAIQAE